jgi:hypothetical protein
MNMHVPSGFRTHEPNIQAASYLPLTPHSHRDPRVNIYLNQIIYGINNLRVVALEVSEI